MTATTSGDEVFQQIFNATTAPMAVYRLSDGCLIESNQSFLALCGLPAENVIGREVFSSPFWNNPKAIAELLSAVSLSRELQESEARVNAAGGEIRELLVSARFVSIDDQPCALLTACDITERLRHEANLRQTQKMEAVAQLASGFAHGFNNILAIIQGYTSLVLAGERLDPQGNKALKEVAIAAERGANLTRQLLVLSRRQVMQASVVDLNAFVTGLDSVLRQLLGAKIRTQFDVSSKPLFVKVDTRMIEQVLVNLASNARDAMPNGGRFNVELSAITQGGRSCASIEIRDTGCGMAPATLNRLFEPFFTTKDIGKGVGLGLSTSHGIIKQHQGSIEVLSEVGKGTVFRVFLPVHEQPAAEPSSCPPIKKQVRPGHIMVVEDERPSRSMVESILVGNA